MIREGETTIEVRGLMRAFDGRTVLDIDHLTVTPGEILVVLGPSGSGKSVLLRILNLLEQPDAGNLRFGGHEVTGLEGADRLAVSRRMAMIFQDPLLFRGTVLENVAYGLKVRRVPLEERKARVAELLKAVKLEGLGGRYIDTLSGGEAQRVALARALVIEPEVMFLDEPFANLDTPSRLALQKEVKGILRERRMTAVFVTHDQEEAARLGDRIMVLNEGRIIQQGSPRDIFYEPESDFVAGFVGFDNILDGEVTSCEGGLACVSVEGLEFEAVTDISPGTKVRLGIRPEDVTLVPASTLAVPASSRNAFTGEVTDIELRGPVARVTMACPFPLVALVTRRSLEELGIEVASEIGARFKATAVVVIGEHR